MIAIAITLLVLDIAVPAPDDGGRDLARELAHHWPDYAAYATSFATIGIVWINHHATLRRVRHVDHPLLLLNLLLLSVIGILPWSTRLVAEYLRAPHGSHLAAVLYGLSFMLLTAAFYAMQRHLLFSPAKLIHNQVPEPERRRIDRRARMGIVPYAIATLSGLVSAYLTLGLCALIAVYYALPTTVYESRPAETPPT